VKHLSAAELAELRSRLERDRERLSARLRGVLSDEREDDVVRADAAATEDARQGRLRGVDADQRRLAAVEGALARMDAGNYGLCEETGEPIPFARLAAEPTTRYTVEAAESLAEDERSDLDPRRDPGAY
jgi:DnaK suppressor protein